jgi:uncharacterized protein YndB with AHSA1/START domain
MAHYEFQTTWQLDAPVERVFELLRDSARYPDWWKGVKQVDLLDTGNDNGIGDVSRFTWRSVLPYSLTFDLRVTRVEAPFVIEGRATGELEGTGVWTLSEADGRGTTVVYDWRVRTTRRWMNAFGPLARPAFVWNHDIVMREGARGLATALGAPPVVSGRG